MMDEYKLAASVRLSNCNRELSIHEARFILEWLHAMMSDAEIKSISHSALRYALILGRDLLFDRDLTFDEADDIAKVLRQDDEASIVKR